MRPTTSTATRWSWTEAGGRSSRCRKVSALAPFRVRSFRFQWPADLVTSWAFEMEALILGWYVLATTGSVQLLVVVGALAWLGSLFAPFFGIAGDRIGVRRLLCLTRGGYALLAALLAWLTLSGRLEPWHVLVVAGLAGLMKPSDMAMRHVLVGHTIPSESLMGALAISRTTSDTARIFGAIAGTGGVALIGMGQAYAGVSLIYVGAFLFSLGVAPVHASGAQVRILTGLKEGVRYVWDKPDLLGAFSLAFLVNFLAYPFFLGLLPYVARNVYGMEQSGLGWLAGAFAVGALAGSLVVSANRLPLRAARVMLLSSALWFVLILVFGQVRSAGTGIAILFLVGFVQSFCMTPIAAVMLRASSEEMRGRVMGIRMLAIWGLPLGLVASGPIIAGLGFAATTLIYGGLGLAATVAIGYRWQQALWEKRAAANAHL
ncbi:MAG TPA: MFS transporter [Burkholderiales bacterium]|nr:MFS transporter [Burkholderiales bacterium]